MKKIKYFSLILFLLSIVLSGQDKIEKSHRFDKIDCKSCHKCDHPTAKDPCLLGCGRFELMSTIKYTGVVPENIIIDELENRYSPVEFSHKAHADMAEMSGSCTFCHHNSINNELEPCRNCHNEERNRKDVSIPDLQGAYHQQCMNCHREWSKETECNSCHLLIEDEHEDINITSSEMNKKITQPKKIRFNTKSDEGNIVTLYHNQHVNNFELECKDCHQNKKCVSCHDVELLSKRTENNELNLFTENGITEEEAHRICSNCHEVEKKCQVCHGTKEKESFNHKSSTGWELKNYHKDLKCKTCHGDKKKFTKLNSNCSGCHENWDLDNFDHKITGLILDENHNELECEDCHSGKNYSVSPSCDNCHDEIKFPERIPGTYIMNNK